MSPRKHIKVAALSTLLVLVLLAPVIGVLAHFASHALPGTTVAGISVSGLNRDQVAAQVASFSGKPVTFVAASGETVVASLEDVGIAVDPQGSVDQVFAPSASIASRAAGLFGGNQVRPVVEVDEQALTEFVQKQGLADTKDAQDSEVVFDPDTGAFVATDPEDGSELDTDALLRSLSQSLADGDEPSVIPLRQRSVAPAVNKQDAEAAAEVANEWLTVEVRASDGDATLATAAPHDVASWIEFQPDNGAVAPRVNHEAVEQWVADAAKQGDQTGRDAVQNVDESGNVVADIDPGTEGRQATNTAQVAQQIASALPHGAPVNASIDYQATEPDVVQIPLVPGDEPLAYSPAPGEKWIDLNIAEARLTAYEGTTPVMRVPFVPGATNTPTVEGTFKTFVKLDAEDMAGLNYDGTPWAYPAVPWVMYFHGLYAIHGAYWRDDFGQAAPEDGSHGCANVSPEAAKVLYDWAPVGTTVVSHR